MPRLPPTLKKTFGGQILKTLLLLLLLLNISEQNGTERENLHSKFEIRNSLDTKLRIEIQSEFAVDSYPQWWIRYLTISMEVVWLNYS